MTRLGRGLTFTEMLVVVAIIVLIAGIISAVLGPAREKARQAACAANLRQIHRALMLYSADYEGREPEGRTSFSRLGLPPNSPATFGRYGNGGLFTAQYVKDPRLWTCPNNPCTFALRLHPECRSQPRRCCKSYVAALVWMEDTITPGVGRFEDAAAQCGDRLPLYFCPWHGEAQGINSHVLVLRWNGLVKGVFRRIPRTPCLD